MKKTWHALRKTVIAVFGAFVVILGVVLIPLPGPGLIVVLIGLLILSTEFHWARRWRDDIRRRIDRVVKHK